MLGKERTSDPRWKEALSKADDNQNGAIDLVEFEGVFKEMMGGAVVDRQKL